MLLRFFTLAILIAVSSCANLYKERAYVSDVAALKNLKGECSSTGAQNKFILKTKKGDLHISTPIHFDYWWTGPLIFPLFPKAKERPDPSFIMITLIAKSELLDRDELMKTELLIKNEIDPIKPMTVVYHSDNETEKFILQFDSPKLVDLKKFRLKFEESISKDILTFYLAYDVHYVPILPVMVSNCVTD